MFVALLGTGSSLLLLHKLGLSHDRVQVYDDKLKVVELAIELINAALEQWPFSNCSLPFQQNKTFS